MYKYYYKVNKKDEVVCHFNYCIQRPDENDIFDKEYSDRNLNLKIFDLFNSKYLYKNDKGKMVLKTPTELEDTIKEKEEKEKEKIVSKIQTGIADAMLQYIEDNPDIDIWFKEIVEIAIQ